MTLPDELRDLLAMSLVPGLGPKIADTLLRHFGSAALVRQATVEQLLKVDGIGQKSAKKFAEHLKSDAVQQEIALLRKHAVSVAARGSIEYPPLLQQIADAPLILYVRGQLAPEDCKAIALVGSRNCTAYGRRVTEELAAGLVRAGYTVVSGLARGIDGHAHRAAVRAGGRTLAVLGNGLSHIYPPEHSELAEDVEKSGAILSEYPMQTAPSSTSFPARNRIISGLTRGVVVIEAGTQSGTLWTVQHALEQGREVFAVPGRVDAETSAGALALLRQGARLIRNIDDLLEDLQGLSPLLVNPPETQPRKRSTSTTVATQSGQLDLLATLMAEPPAVPPSSELPPGLTDAQQKVWQLLAEPRHADELTRELGLHPGEMSRLLMQLELRRAIRRLPGNRYERS